MSVERSYSRLLDEHAIHVVTISGADKRRALPARSFRRLQSPAQNRGRWALRFSGRSPTPVEPRPAGRAFAFGPGCSTVRSPLIRDEEGLPARSWTSGKNSGSSVRISAKRLLKLHDLATDDWRRFAAALDLDASKHTAGPHFWSRLFDVFSRDLDDSLARHLHIDRDGYARLAAERPVVSDQPYRNRSTVLFGHRRSSTPLAGRCRNPPFWRRFEIGQR